MLKTTQKSISDTHVTSHSNKCMPQDTATLSSPELRTMWYVFNIYVIILTSETIVGGITYTIKSNGHGPK